MIDLNLWNKKRREQKITLDILSKKSGIPLNTLKNIFSGRTPTPRIDTVQAIERALGLSNAPKEHVQSNHTMELNSQQIRMINAFNSLIPAMQEYVIEITEKLAAQTRIGNDKARIG